MEEGDLKRTNNIKRLNAVMPPQPERLSASRDIGGEWIVRNQRGHVIASAFDTEDEAKAFIAERSK